MFEVSCYIVVEERLQWTDARARCVALGGHVVIIESQAENQVVFDSAQLKRQKAKLAGCG